MLVLSGCTKKQEITNGLIPVDNVQSIETIRNETKVAKVPQPKAADGIEIPDFCSDLNCFISNFKITYHSPSSIYCNNILKNQIVYLNFKTFISYSK